MTLTIAAGVRVEFQGHYRLDVRGRLLAFGTASDPVLLTSGDPGAFKIDASLDGAWNGLRFERTSAVNNPSRLEYCVIEYAKSIRDSIFVGPLVCDDYSGLRVVNATIRRNVADYGAAVFCFHCASPQLTGCLIYDNYAFLGGAAVYTLDSYPRLINCTIAHNHDLNPEAMTEAAAVLSYFSKPRITDCILWDNTTNYFIPAQLWEVKPYNTTWSDIDGGWKGEGNIDLDPDFAGAGNDPYSLQSSSPCINAAAPDTAGLLLPALDRAGRPRVAGGRVDIGAYEERPLSNGPSGSSLTAHARLLPNRPNPFHPRTAIAFALDHPRKIAVEIFDLSGRRIRTLSHRRFDAGEHTLIWNGLDTSGRGVAPGVYWVQLRDGTILDSRKIILIR